jgi:hypothetical protein
MQYNKRDLADPYALEELHRKLSMRGVAAFEAVAKDGTGVLQTLTTISKRVIRHLRERQAEPEAAPTPAAKPKTAAAPGDSATQVRLTPPPAAPRPAPPPGVTQLIDRAAFEATLAKPAAPPPGTTQLLERVVSPEDSQPGIEAAPATFADTVAEAEALFEDEFETTKQVATPRAKAPAVKLDAGEGDLALAIEPAGPAQPAPGGLRVPLWVRDSSGKRRKLTLSLRFESEDS